MRPVTLGPPRRILVFTAIQEIFKEVNQLPNPLAIGVSLGGLLLEIVAPRPKPRAGFAHESSLLSPRAHSRTPRRATIDDEHDGTPVASGSIS
jgi:hypothetical protein